jgi:hypothetical protein
VRDARFDWDTTRRYWKGLDDRATQFLALFTDLEPVRRLLVDWWSLERQSVPRSVTPEHRRSSTDRLRSTAATLSRVFQPLIEGIAQGIVQGQSDNPEARGGSRLLGMVLGEVTATGPVQGEIFNSTVRFLSGLWPAEDAYEEAFLSSIPTSTRAAWLTELNSLPSDLEALVDRRPWRRPLSPQDIHALEAKARAKGLAAYPWDHAGESPDMRIEWFRRAEIVLQLDPTSYAGIVDALPTLELRRHLCRHHSFGEDRSLILAVLRDAAPVIVRGKWDGHIAGLLALELSLTHLERLAEIYRRTLAGPPGAARNEASLSVATFESTETEDWLDTVMDVTLARPDGLALVSVFAVHLVQALASRRNSSRGWSAAPVFLNSLARRAGTSVTATYAKALAGICSGPNAIPDAFPYLLTATIVGQDPVGLWEWYLELLKQTAPGIASGRYSRADDDWVYQSIASTLADQPDPVARWTNAWRALFGPDRERARFDPTDIHALSPSQHLVRVGVGLFAHREGRQSLTDAVLSTFWQTLTTAARYLAMDSRRPERVTPDFEGEIFRCLPVVFRDTWIDVVDLEALRLRHDPTFCVFVAAALVRGGASRPDALEKMAARGYDPLAALAKLDGRPRMNDALRAAALEIGVAPTRPSPATG